MAALCGRALRFGAQDHASTGATTRPAPRLSYLVPNTDPYLNKLPGLSPRISTPSSRCLAVPSGVETPSLRLTDPSKTPRNRSSVAPLCDGKRACDALPELASSTSCYTGPEPARSSASQGKDPERGAVASPAFLLLATCLAVALALPEGANASEELSASALEMLRQFLEQVNDLGAPGVLLVLAGIIFAEMVPLVPTQPLSLASGLLYGPLQGAAVVLTGVSVAAFNSFFLSRGIGKELAKKVLAFELKPEHVDGGDKTQGAHNVVARKFKEMRDTVECGSMQDQIMAILLLRLTPIVPFSASNYVIGMTSIPFAPFAIGTVAGMAGWSLLYASLGGAGRALLLGGVDLGTVLSDMMEQASTYSASLGKLSVLLIAGALVLYYWRVGGAKEGLVEKAGEDMSAALGRLELPPEVIPFSILWGAARCTRRGQEQETSRGGHISMG